MHKSLLNGVSIAEFALVQSIAVDFNAGEAAHFSIGENNIMK